MSPSRSVERSLTIIDAVRLQRITSYPLLTDRASQQRSVNNAIYLSRHSSSRGLRRSGDRPYRPLKFWRWFLKLTIVGTGYVGLVTGACLSDIGNDVLCFDVDAEKIRMLDSGGIPIYEPGLASLVKRNV